MSITTQNANQIRDAMDISVSLSAVDSSADLTFASSGEKAIDTNISTSLDQQTWPQRLLADLSGDGFALDGDHVCLDSTAASLTYGKIGIISSIGGTFTVTVTSSATIDAVTLILDGSGTVSDGTNTYDVREFVVIPMSGTTATLTFTAADSERITLLKMLPGVSMAFDNSNLTSVTLGLRSCTDIADASWEVSEIEAKAYWPDDITTAIGNLPDDVPITYSAGYSDDMSKTRYFYLSEPATMESNQITLKGEDASARLEDATLPITVLKTKRSTAQQKMYVAFRDTIKKYAKITPRIVDSAPSTAGTSTKRDTLILLSTSARDRVAEMMNLHYASSDSTRVFWPTFVDAGYPCITWQKPTASDCNRGRGIWTIYEDDCADVSRSVDRNVNKITSSDSTYGVETYCKIHSKATTFESGKKLKAGKIYTVTFDGYVDPSTIRISTGARGTVKVISKTPEKVVFKALATTGTYKKRIYYKDKKHKKRSPGNKKTKYYKVKTIKSKAAKITAKSIEVSDVHKTLAKSRPGTSIQVQPTIYGRQCNSNGNRLFPAYSALFQRSNETIKFTWKGDPRMQPRDLAYIVPKEIRNTNAGIDTWTDMTDDEKADYIYTIDDITLSHSEGGTSAEISARKGIC